MGSHGQLEQGTSLNSSTEPDPDLGPNRPPVWFPPGNSLPALSPTPTGNLIPLYFKFSAQVQVCRWISGSLINPVELYLQGRCSRKKIQASDFWAPENLSPEYSRQGYRLALPVFLARLCGVILTLEEMMKTTRYPLSCLEHGPLPGNSSLGQTTGL